MSFADITALLSEHFAVEAITANYQPYLAVRPDELVPLCQFLRNDERLFFDLLACITAIDNGPSRSAGAVDSPEKATMEVIYNLTSIPYGHDLMLKLTVARQNPADPDGLPNVPSLAGVWRTADWHEREAFDLVGIRFVGHPDLRRILLPTDWPGHPLRTDYQEPDQYHGIITK
jgi:NADH-quinone oxidoreductase subunit C